MGNVEMSNDLEILNQLTPGTVSNAAVAPSASLDCGGSGTARWLNCDRWSARHSNGLCIGEVVLQLAWGSESPIAKARYRCQAASRLAHVPFRAPIGEQEPFEAEPA